MSPLYPINNWCDVNIYFNVGKSMFEGRTLYTETFDHKGPLIFIIYGIGYLISNSSFLGVFIIQVFAWSIMLYSIYFSSKLLINKQLALIVSFIFPFFLFRFTDYGGSAEEFILVFQSISLYFFLKYFKEKNEGYSNPKFMLIHGLMSSMVFFIKLNLILFWFFPLLGIFICIVLNKNIRNLILNIAYYLIGFGIVAIPICLYFYLNDALTEAYNVYIVMNSKYASIPDTTSGIISLLLHRIYMFFRSDMLGATSILLGIFYFPIKHLSNNIGKVAFVLCGISLFLIISITQSFFGYYKLPFYIFNALGWISILSYIGQYSTIYLQKKATTVICVIFILLSINQKSFFDVGGEVFFDKKKATGLVFEFASDIEQIENPQLLNLGFGYANGLFTHCNIKPNITYFITPNLPHNLYPKLRDEQTKYIENKQVDFIVLTNATMNYEYFKELPALKENYELINAYIDTESYFEKTNEFYTYYLYKKIN